MRSLTLRIYEILPNQLYQSPVLTEWKAISDRGITVIFDLEGGLDNIIPRPDPDKLIYLCHPILDGPLPDMEIMWWIAELGEHLIKKGKRVLVHCAAGINRASFLNGLIIHKLKPNLNGSEIIKIIQTARPGALTNPIFRRYLNSLKGS